jgi:hypothetical protein
MLTRIYRDKQALPQPLRRMIDSADSHYREVLLAPFAGSRPQQRRLRAVLGHAVSFWTWRSLCIEQGLSDREAVEAMATLVLATATGSSPAHPLDAAEPVIVPALKTTNRLTDQA